MTLARLASSASRFATNMLNQSTERGTNHESELEVYLDHLRRAKLQRERDINAWLKAQLIQPWSITDYRSKTTQRSGLITPRAKATHA